MLQPTMNCRLLYFNATQIGSEASKYMEPIASYKKVVCPPHASTALGVETYFVKNINYPALHIEHTGKTVIVVQI